MTLSALAINFGDAVHVSPGNGRFDWLIVCEHASNRIPEGLGGLGLSDEVRRSHIAWDPGAAGVARAMAEKAGVPLVSGGISRLVYDCNRPPDAESAVPVVSEIYEIPGNRNLSAAARQDRVEAVYKPFRDTLAQQIDDTRDDLRLLVTVHSFNPVFFGEPRDAEVGLLHGDDDRFARAMVGAIPRDFPFETRLNEPYSAADGVAYTLDDHGVKNGLLNVMIELRNDLIGTADQQRDMADRLVSWIADVFADFEKAGRR